MRRLHNFQLSPFCRKVRLVLGEKKLPFESVLERPWEPRADLVPLDPSGELPVLIEDDGLALADAQAIAEYLEELHPAPPLMPKWPAERAEVRRVAAWFDRTFFNEVSAVVTREKLLKRYRKGASSEPNAQALRASLEALRVHLEFIAKLAEERDWLAGALSLADLTAAAHFSCVDYFGDVPWDDYPRAQEWYARLKSRPCFRPLLADHLPGFPPAPDYANLDF
ncbi:MAG: glutathione S-transferase family protein [Alphaproteobacteria bacterium]|nr:glutathione S-transferase family protein [Alphaproteobacteria bacterium]